jgi:DNA repair photolyase
MQRRIFFKVEQDRVLVPVGEPCPFGCRYCYTREGTVGLGRVPIEDILCRLGAFMRETPFATIQLGYDGDPFARPERGLVLLEKLASLHKHVNFSTKAWLEGTILDRLGALRRRMAAEGKTLSALVSLSCWDSAPLVEPHTPSPRERMRTVANLRRMGLPVFIVIRPVLPQIAEDEYRRIVTEGLLAGGEGFIVGPLYADSRGRFVRFIEPDVLSTVPGKTAPVSWSAHAPTWTRYEDPLRLERLIQMIEEQGGHAFQSSAQVMRLLEQREAVR